MVVWVQIWLIQLYPFGPKFCLDNEVILSQSLTQIIACIVGKNFAKITIVFLDQNLA